MAKKEKKRIGNFQIEDIKFSFRFTIVAIILIFLILLFLSNLVNIFEKIENKANKESTKKDSLEDTTPFFSKEGSGVLMYLPAVDSRGKGIYTLLKVEAFPGSGRTLTDIDNLLFWADTQHSIRIAKRVAENITGKKEEDYDVIYTIKANASLIGGPSAGAALAIATIAALENKELNKSVMITGVVNHDGSIGPVSGILEKAKAAKEAGATLFLVPLLQSRDVVYETSKHCEVFGNTKICTTETRPKKIEVEKEADIKVREVSSIQEAMEYFFK